MSNLEGPSEVTARVEARSLDKLAGPDGSLKAAMGGKWMSTQQERDLKTQLMGYLELCRDARTWANAQRAERGEALKPRLPEPPWASEWPRHRVLGAVLLVLGLGFQVRAQDFTVGDLAAQGCLGMTQPGSNAYECCGTGPAPCVNNITWTGTHTYDSAELGVPSGNTNPATCSPAFLFYDLDDTELNMCSATDTWTPIAGDGFSSYVFQYQNYKPNKAATVAGCERVTGPIVDMIQVWVIWEGSDDYPAGLSHKFSFYGQCSGATNCDLTLSAVGGAVDYFSLPDLSASLVFTTDTSVASLPTGQTIAQILISVDEGHTLDVCAASWEIYK